MFSGYPWEACSSGGFGGEAWRRGSGREMGGMREELEGRRNCGRDIMYEKKYSAKLKTNKQIRILFKRK